MIEDNIWLIKPKKKNIQIRDILVFTNIIVFTWMFQRVYQFFSIHNFGSFASASKTIPLFMHFKDSTLSGRFTIAQVFTTLHFMSNQIYMLSDRKMYIFSNYYTTIRPIWNLKETWKKVISLNTILFAIKHATRGCGFSQATLKWNGEPDILCVISSL